jgi:hypothetical protein
MDNRAKKLLARGLEFVDRLRLVGPGYSVPVAAVEAVPSSTV